MARSGQLYNPPLIGIFFAVLLLSATSIMHVFHSTKLPTQVNDIEKSSLLRSANEYIAKLEEEIRAVEEKLMGPIPPTPSVVVQENTLAANTPNSINPEHSTTVETVATELSGLMHFFDGSKSAEVVGENVGVVAAMRPNLLVLETPVDEATQTWLEQLYRKLRCLYGHHGGVYLYHVRKAAGTTVRDVLAHITKRWRVKLFETEGLSLDGRFMEFRGVFSVVTLRDPIDRIMSLYWYEHVGWFDGILKEKHKCKTLKVWVDAWRDGSEWKTKFVQNNPRTVYVEIENYYVKMLTGWVGPAPVGEKDLAEAKRVLASFDLLLLTEWMGDDSQVSAMNALFPGRGTIAAGHKVKGDENARKRLKKELATDEAEVKELLKQINKYDLALFDYAQSLMARRLKHIQPLVKKVKDAEPLTDEESCGPAHLVLPKELGAQLGIFRPPGHKGPLL